MTCLRAPSGNFPAECLSQRTDPSYCTTYPDSVSLAPHALFSRFLPCRWSQAAYLHPPSPSQTPVLMSSGDLSFPCRQNKRYIHAARQWCISPLGNLRSFWEPLLADRLDREREKGGRKHDVCACLMRPPIVINTAGKTCHGTGYGTPPVRA